MNRYAIIVAGGSGSRMKSEIPKQFLTLNGKPILMHTIDRFRQTSANIQVRLVLPKEQIAFWQDLCVKYTFDSYNIKVIMGGNTRFYSVKNGLDSIESSNGLVAIHDGVRPLVSKQIIDESFNTAQTEGNAIASVASKDSLREITNEDNRAVDRTKYRLIQTPQTFRLELIKKAFEQNELDKGFTDDASVLEEFGAKIKLIEGSYENIKITTPEDLVLAEAILKRSSEDMP